MPILASKPSSKPETKRYSPKKTKFFVFDQELMWCSGAWRLLLEGNDVRVLSQSQYGVEHLENMVPHAKSMNEGLSWVGKDGYIICGDEQDLTHLRKRGFKCYGGNAWINRIENDRKFQADICKEAGLKISAYHAIKTPKEAIEFIKKNPKRWCLKQDGSSAPKSWNFVGKHDDGSDCIDQLNWMMSRPVFKKIMDKDGSVPFMLMECVDGEEAAIGCHWIGKDWKRRDDGSILMEVNFENKKDLNGDLGLTTGEAFTVAKFCEAQKFYQHTLEKLVPALKKNASDVVIDIDFNGGITESGEAYVFEICCREGYPISALQQHLLKTETGKFFADLIDGHQGGVEHHEEWGVVSVLGCGNYPNEQQKDSDDTFKDQPVRIPQWEKSIDMDVQPFYIKYDPKDDLFRVADTYESPILVCKHDKDILKAGQMCVDEMKKIDVRAPHFRTDLGKSVVEKRLPALEKHGYL